MRKLLSLILFLPLALAGHAQSRTTDKSLLWQISGKSLDKPSYLFGTIHLICPDDYIWTRQMHESFKKAEEVCFEMDMDDPAVLMIIAKGMQDPSGKTLEDYFSADDYAKLSDYIRDTLGMSIAMFDSMKPTILPMIFSGRSGHCPAPVSYEDRLMDSAKAYKKNIVGIETPEEQIAVFNSLSTDSIVKEVMDMVNGAQSEDTTYEKLIKAYKSQDLPALNRLMNESKDLEKNKGAFLDDRTFRIRINE